MKYNVTIPHVGESVQEALLSQWYKQSGDLVHKDEPLLLIETDKVTLEITAEVDGKLEITVGDEQTVAVGSVVGAIDTEAAPEIQEQEPSVENKTGREPTPGPSLRQAQDIAQEGSLPTPGPSQEGSLPTPGPSQEGKKFTTSQLPPSVRRLVAEQELDVSKIPGTGPGGKITKGDVLVYLEKQAASRAQTAASRMQTSESARAEEAQSVTRKPMSPIRKRIATRLLEARHSTAMLTTFNEIDMSLVIDLRQQYKELFQKKYDIKLGFMSFFVKACLEGLKEVPQLNAFIEGDDLVYHHYYHIGVAVGSERGLVVPVIRHADQLSFAEVERTIQRYVEKITTNRLELSDLEGGTFTITNGGVFGSLLSTPILNTPQSGILGMHKIDKRPVVVDDEVVIRPMMYVALSYDHRIVDGRESVLFLKRIKECIEHPERMMLEV